MEGSSELPEITVVPAPAATAAGGGAVRAGEEPSSPGSPSQVASRVERPSGRGRGRAMEAAVIVPAWKLDSLCKESGARPAMRGGFPRF